MRFTQPNDLARAMHQVLNNLITDHTISLRFGSEAEVWHVLETLQEVAQARQVVLMVHSTGDKTLELSLAEPSA